MWYLVLEIEQGQQAYQAKDHRFYKRVGNTVQPMEQYEVVDVMNRTRAAALCLRVVDFRKLSQTSLTWRELGFGIAITSTNYVASEHGAFKLTLAYPLRFASELRLWGASSLKRQTGLRLREGIAHAQSVMVRWGAHKGNVIFPGDWFDFYGHRFGILVPKPEVIPNPTYLFQIEIFTLNSTSKINLYAIQIAGESHDFRLVEVDPSERDKWEASFWRPTYHKAIETLSAMSNRDLVAGYENRVIGYEHVEGK